MLLTNNSLCICLCEAILHFIITFQWHESSVKCGALFWGDFSNCITQIPLNITFIDCARNCVVLCGELWYFIIKISRIIPTCNFDILLIKGDFNNSVQWQLDCNWSEWNIFNSFWNHDLLLQASAIASKWWFVHNLYYDYCIEFDSNGRAFLHLASIDKLICSFYLLRYAVCRFTLWVSRKKNLQVSSFKGIFLRVELKHLLMFPVHIIPCKLDCSNKSWRL